MRAKLPEKVSGERWLAFMGWPTTCASRPTALCSSELWTGCLLVLMSPVYGLYAFLGYLGRLSSRVAGNARPPWWSRPLPVPTQIGGSRSPLWSWPVYALFLAVNIGVALLIMLIERQRERTMLDLERVVAELRDSEERNARLQDQL